MVEGNCIEFCWRCAKNKIEDVIDFHSPYTDFFLTCYRVVIKQPQTSQNKKVKGELRILGGEVGFLIM